LAGWPSSAGLEWLFVCSASGMPLLSSSLVSSPRGLVSLASTAVAPVAGAALLPAGSVAAAPSEVPGVVAEDDGALDEEDAPEEEAGAAGTDDPGEPAPVAAGVEEPGAEEAGEAGGGATRASSERLHPASSRANSGAASHGSRLREDVRFIVVVFIACLWSAQPGGRVGRMGLQKETQGICPRLLLPYRFTPPAPR
jgi:hypothetical protein